MGRDALTSGAVSPMVSAAGLATRGEASKAIALVGVDLDRYDRIVGLRSKVVDGTALLALLRDSDGDGDVDARHVGTGRPGLRNCDARRDRPAAAVFPRVRRHRLIADRQHAMERHALERAALAPDRQRRQPARTAHVQLQSVALRDRHA